MEVGMQLVYVLFSYSFISLLNACISREVLLDFCGRGFTTSEVTMFFSLLFPTLNNVNLTGKNLVILFCSFLLLALSFVSSNFISHLHFFCELFLVHACFSTWLLCFFTFAFVYKDYYILVMYSVFSLSSSALTIYSFPLACSITVCSSFIILSFFGSKLSHS